MAVRDEGAGQDEGAGHDAVPGDREERARDFRRYVEPELEVLLRVGRTLTGSWAEAEDLVQETMIRAYRAIDRFDGRHPRAWLLTILRNTNVNLHRRRRPDLVGDWETVPRYRPAFGAKDPPTAEDDALHAELGAELERAVAALGARFREVLLLVDVDQLTYAEAADVLGIPVGTVMSRLHRARDRVRTALRTNPRGRRRR